MHKPEIAIIDSNTLTVIGLQGLLEEIIPMAVIRTFHSFAEFMDDTPDMRIAKQVNKLRDTVSRNKGLL